MIAGFVRLASRVRTRRLAAAEARARLRPRHDRLRSGQRARESRWELLGGPRADVPYRPPCRTASAPGNEAHESREAAQCSTVRSTRLTTTRQGQPGVVVGADEIPCLQQLLGAVQREKALGHDHEMRPSGKRPRREHGGARPAVDEGDVARHAPGNPAQNNELVGGRPCACPDASAVSDGARSKPRVAVELRSGACACPRDPGAAQPVARRPPRVPPHTTGDCATLHPVASCRRRRLYRSHACARTG